MMRRYFWLWLILALLPLAGCKSGGKGGQGLILHQTLDEAGMPRPELVVIDPQGQERHRVHLSETLRGGFPMDASHRALVYTLDDLVYLVDAQAGTAQPLALSGEAFPYVAQFRFSGGGARWTLLGSPRGDLAYLVNLETGQVHDLTTVDPDAKFYFTGLFAPDEKHLLLGADSDLWLIPTANLKDARRLGTGKTTFAASFSSDGRQIAYVQRAETGEFEVVLEQVDGSGSEVVASDTFIDWVVFVPDKKQLALAGKEKVSLLNLDDGTERELLTFAEQTRRAWFAPGGKKLLLGDESQDGTVWYLVDLKSGTAQALDDVKGYFAYFWDPGHRWLTFLDDPALGVGRRFLSLDLESGAVRQLLVFDEETRFIGIQDTSHDGRFGLVTAMTKDNQMQLWLLRAGGGEPRLLVEARAVHGAFSPDGRWVAVSTLEGEGEQRKAQLTLMETGGEETRSLGEGFRAIWVRP